MFPLKDSIKSEKTPFVNYAIILVNIFVFYYQLKLGSRLSLFYLDYGVVAQKFFAPFSVIGFSERIYPLFTYMFLPNISSQYRNKPELDII